MTYLEGSVHQSRMEMVVSFVKTIDVTAHPTDCFRFVQSRLLDTHEPTPLNDE